MTRPAENAPLLDVRDLTVHYRTGARIPGRPATTVRAVDGVSFTIDRGETLGLVGESGSGKSTVAGAILRLLEPTGGRVFLDGTEVTALGRRALRDVRPHMQIVFQDPLASLNPRMMAGTAVQESLRVNGIGDRAGWPARVGELFELVGLQRRHLTAYPHELSGGQRQRVGIARALASNPSFVVADEALSALDVSIQAQIVNLLRDLRDELGLTYLFISHDLSMVRHLSDRIAVLYLGQIVETGPADDLYYRPMHPYTLALLSAVPVADPDREQQRRRVVLSGDIPDPAHPPSGCRFHTRCPFATDRCATEEPAARVVEGRQVACHHVDRVAEERAKRALLTYQRDRY